MYDLFQAAHFTGCLRPLRVILRLSKFLFNELCIGIIKISLQVQLFKLMQQLENTTPHFVCCIKPNNKQLPGVFEKELVLQQLRYSGVLEAVRISRSGYPTKMTHQYFSDRWVPNLLFCCWLIFNWLGTLMSLAACVLGMVSSWIIMCPKIL